MKSKNKEESLSLLDEAKNAVLLYGKMTIEDRALPDFRDGMKPVHRRIMWGMYKLGLWPTGNFRKVANVVGDVMGHYHPHGDLPITQALVNLANSSIPLIHGQGNYGNVYGGDSAAAGRYIECKLTKYAAKCIVNPEYLDVAVLHDNYDGRVKEPLYLPVTAPNLLLNGTYGIAMGATAAIPPFHPDGVFYLVEKALNGEKVTVKNCMKKLRINYPKGGHFGGEENALEQFYKIGKSGLRLSPDYEVNVSKKTITITGAPFGVTLEKVVDRLAEHTRVSKIDNLPDSKNEIKTVIFLKSTVSEREVQSVADTLMGIVSHTLAGSVAVTERVNEKEKTFLELNIPNLIHRWVDYRVDLEKRVQDYRISTFDGKIANNKLFILAANNRAIILEALKSDNPALVIEKKLKITEAQANQILDLQIRRLSKLSENELNNTINNLKKERKEAVDIKAKPKSRIMELLNKSI